MHQACPHHRAIPASHTTEQHKDRTNTERNEATHPELGRNVGKPFVLGAAQELGGLRGGRHGLCGHRRRRAEAATLLGPRGLRLCARSLLARDRRRDRFLLSSRLDHALAGVELVLVRRPGPTERVQVRGVTRRGFLAPTAILLACPGRCARCVGGRVVIGAVGERATRGGRGGGAGQHGDDGHALVAELVEVGGEVVLGDKGQLGGARHANALGRASQDVQIGRAARSELRERGVEGQASVPTD